MVRFPKQHLLTSYILMITFANMVSQNQNNQYVRYDLDAKLFDTDSSLHKLSLKNKPTNDKYPAFKGLRNGSSGGQYSRANWHFSKYSI